jgi:hypothetical protein
MTERERSPLGPNELPPELAEFLRPKDYACLIQAADQGTVLIVKAPGREIESVRGTVPIQLRHELHRHPAAPVIRMLLTIYDQPGRPLALETFINVADPQQRDDFAALSSQHELRLLFYDEQLRHQLSKRVALRDQVKLRGMLVIAQDLRHAIPEQAYDFDAAKAAVMEHTTLFDQMPQVVWRKEDDDTR